MDLWAAIINVGSADENVLSIYSSEELALQAAELASPGAAITEHYVLDKTPEWVAHYVAEQEAAKERPDR